MIAGPKETRSNSLPARQLKDRRADAFSTCDHQPCQNADLVRQLLPETIRYLRARESRRQPDSCSRQAWDTFYRIHAPLVRRVITACGLSGHDADDCAQEVWIAITRGLAQSAYDSQKGPFGRWALRVVHNRVVDFVRSVARQRMTLSPAMQGKVCSRQTDPVTDCERAEQRGLVRHVLGHLRQDLSTTNYRIVHLRWIREIPASQVAVRLNLSPQQVRYRHYRIKSRLRILLQSHGYGEGCRQCGSFCG